MNEPYTKFPNWIIDNVMPECSPNEWKIVCAIVRNTIGWNKDSDIISYTQIETAAGIKSRKTISDCIQSLVDKGIVRREKAGRQSFKYSIKLVQNMNQFKNCTSSKIEPDITKTSSKIEPELVQKLNTQKKKENINKVTIYAALFEGLTGFSPPHETSAHYEDDWYKPLSAIIEQSSNDAEIEQRITYGITQNRKNGYTIKSPKSIRTFALNYQQEKPVTNVVQSNDGGMYV